MADDALAELQRMSAEGSTDYTRVLQLADSALAADPSSAVDALSCKLVALIHLSRFEDALAAIAAAAAAAAAAAGTSSSSSSGAAFAFERAYCHYRLHQLSEALAAIEQCSSQDLKVKELHAQILYRQEAFQECVALYKKIMAEHKLSGDAEHLTNYLSAIAGAVVLSPETSAALLNEVPANLSTFELCYNSACIDIARTNLTSAATKLEQAEDLCKKTLEAEGFDESEILAELGVIQVQLAVVLHLQDRIEEAMAIYNLILKSRPSDVVVAAIASNNIVAINKDRETFDSKKRIQATLAEGLDKKLNSHQRRVMAVNRCLLALHMNQNEQCRQLFESLSKQYPDHDVLILISASLLFKDKKATKAFELLQSYADTHSHAVYVNLTLAQNHLVANNPGQAAASLRAARSLQHRPGMVATLVSVYERMGDVAAAAQVFEEAIAATQTSGAPSKQLLTLMRHAAQFYLRHKQPAQAAVLYERLFRANKKDRAALAGLVLATSHVDAAQAEQYAASLPAIASGEPIDVDALENLVVGRISQRAKDKNAVAASASADATSNPAASGQKAALKKKKKRKLNPKRMPKNFDPKFTPDPERWLPKRERSTYRKGKKKRDLGKGGSQGAASSTPDAASGSGMTGSAAFDGRAKTAAPSATPAAAAPAAAPAATAEPAKKPQQQQHNKKKKKGGR